MELSPGGSVASRRHTAASAALFGCCPGEWDAVGTQWAESCHAAQQCSGWFPDPHNKRTAGPPNLTAAESEKPSAGSASCRPGPGPRGERTSSGALWPLVCPARDRMVPSAQGLLGDAGPRPVSGGGRAPLCCVFRRGVGWAEAARGGGRWGPGTPVPSGPHRPADAARPGLTAHPEDIRGPGRWNSFLQQRGAEQGRPHTHTHIHTHTQQHTQHTHHTHTWPLKQLPAATGAEQGRPHTHTHTHTHYTQHTVHTQHTHHTQHTYTHSTHRTHTYYQGVVRGEIPSSHQSYILHQLLHQPQVKWSVNRSVVSNSSSP